MLRLPDVSPRGNYQISVAGSSREETPYTAPTAGDAAPGVRPTLVLSDQWLVRLLGRDGEPIGIKAFRDFEVEMHQNGQVMPWTNGPLAVAGRAGSDVLVSRQTLILGKGGDPVRFLIETEGGTMLHAEGSMPTDASGRIVARVTENLPADTTAEPTLIGVGADEIAGRAIGPDGQPLDGVRAAFPVLPYQADDATPVLSDAEGVFRLPMPPRYRHAYLTLSKEGWAPVFLTDPPMGRGFRVTLQNTTRLRGTVGPAASSCCWRRTSSRRARAA